MMTTQDMKTELSYMTYKPGWSMSIHETDQQGPFFYVLLDTPNAYQSNESVELRIASHIPWLETVEEFRRWVFWRLRQIEIHECMEWFRDTRTKEPFFNPHKDLDPPRKDVVDGK